MMVASGVGQTPSRLRLEGLLSPRGPGSQRFWACSALSQAHPSRPIQRGSASIRQGQLSLSPLQEYILLTYPQGRERKGKLERITVRVGGDRARSTVGLARPRWGVSSPCLVYSRGRDGKGRC